MKIFFQSVLIGVVLRVVHAAITELQTADERVGEELRRMAPGTAYSIRTGHAGPTLNVEWDGVRLCRRKSLSGSCCRLSVKALPLSFQLFTGQMGLAQAYARHAFTLAGDIADVMKLARLVNLVEAYLFPRFISRRILTDIPPLRLHPLRVYGRLFWGFLRGKY